MSESENNLSSIKKKSKTQKRNIAKLSDALRLNMKRRKQIQNKKKALDENNSD